MRVERYFKCKRDCNIGKTITNFKKGEKYLLVEIDSINNFITKYTFIDEAFEYCDIIDDNTTKILNYYFYGEEELRKLKIKSILD